jgi:imidazole glycerol phosphate synthase glutamine amidotransferase subunit
VSRPVLVVATGVANLASVLAGIRRAGGEPTLGSTPEDVSSASFVVLPGVGAFGAGRAALAERGLDEALVERVNAGRPTLGVCLGMQLFFRSSAETPGVAGMGVVDATVERFGGEGVRVPQLGWNRVEVAADARVLRPGYAFFANSFRAVEAPGWSVARADHGGSFVAAAERGSVLLCQFHPELSGAWGVDLLGRWLAC